MKHLLHLLLLILLRIVLAADLYTVSGATSQTTERSKGSKEVLHVTFDLNYYKSPEKAHSEVESITDIVKEDFYFNEDESFLQLYQTLKRKAVRHLTRLIKNEAPHHTIPIPYRIIPRVSIKQDINEGRLSIAIVKDNQSSEWEVRFKPEDEEPQTKVVLMQKSKNKHCKDLKIIDETQLLVRYIVEIDY